VLAHLVDDDLTLIGDEMTVDLRIQREDTHGIMWRVR
jgi:hypothetical protein